jgi:pimeloyl-ACP methyl ester carboxylesterase
MSDQSDVPAMQYDSTGSGEPLVLVPGGFTGWRSWQPHAEVLAGSRRAIRVQLHNVALGLAGAPLPPDYSVDFEVRALARTLDALGIEQADFAAWSYGTVIALSYAIHHAGRVRSLTLIEPAAYWVLRSRGPLSGEALAEQRFLQTLATDHISEAQLATAMHVWKVVPEATDPRTLPEWPVWSAHRHSLRLADAEFRHEDSMELLRRFDKPVLLVKGEGSNQYTHDIADVLAEELPDASLVTFPGGHAPHLESLQPFLEQLVHFLARRDDSDPAPQGRPIEAGR